MSLRPGRRRRRHPARVHRRSRPRRPQRLQAAHPPPARIARPPHPLDRAGHLHRRDRRCTIDRVNIYQATRLAMLSAVRALAIPPDHSSSTPCSSISPNWPTPAPRPSSSTATRSHSPSPPHPSSPSPPRPPPLCARRHASRLRPRRAQGYATAQHLRALTLLGPPSFTASPSPRQSLHPHRLSRHTIYPVILSGAARALCELRSRRTR